MSDLIRHPEHIDITGFSDKSENDEKWCFLTFYGIINLKLNPTASFIVPALTWDITGNFLGFTWKKLSANECIHANGLNP